MKIHAVLWLEQIEEKIFRKHHVQTHEAEEVFLSQPHIRFMERGHRRGEDLYAAFGRTDEGRYLAVYFLFKRPSSALVVTARDMTNKEKRSYGKKR